MFPSRTESFLVCVQSSWFVGEADIARIALAEHGIPCHIENEHFHMWHWLYASISGGFKVMVPREHAERAAGILAGHGEEDHTEEASAEWECPECGWKVDGDWDVCWFCTTTRDGIRPDPKDDAAVVVEMSFEEETALAQRRAAVVVLPLVALFLGTGGSLGAVVIAASIAFVGFHLKEKKRQPSAEAPTEDVLEAERLLMAQPLAPAEQSRRRREQMGNRVVERALLTAILGVAWFPPLAILSVWLLLRLDRRKTPPSPLHRQQARLAWCVCTVGMLFVVICAGLLVKAGGDTVGLMGTWR